MIDLSAHSLEAYERLERGQAKAGLVPKDIFQDWLTQAAQQAAPVDGPPQGLFRTRKFQAHH